MIVAGIDPGLRSTGLAIIDAQGGPGLPELLHRATIRIERRDVEGQEAADLMARLLLARIAALPRLFLVSADLIALEAFEYRGYLPRRINTVANMGRLVGRVVHELSAGPIEVREIPAGTHKAGYPHDQRTLGRLLPSPLKNRHERDAFLVASCAAAMVRGQLRTPLLEEVGP